MALSKASDAPGPRSATDTFRRRPDSSVNTLALTSMAVSGAVNLMALRMTFSNAR